VGLCEKASIVNNSLTKNIRNIFSPYYVRYNDNFLLGLRFEKKTARAIIHDIQVFIKSDLHLDCYDSSFTRGHSDLFCFLGFKMGGYPAKLNKKSQLEIRLNKIKANLQKKKVAESEKYFKLVEQVGSQMHRRFLSSVRITSKTVFRKSQHKNLGNRNIAIKILDALKLSLYQMESEVISTPVAFDTVKTPNNPQFSSIFSERRKESNLAVLTKKWIQKAMDIVKDEDKVELDYMIGLHLSPRFLEARDAYLTELDKISSKNFNPHEAEVKKMFWGSRKVAAAEANFCSIKIILPLKYLKKKLRCLGVLHKFSTRPVGKPVFSCLKDYEIISWYSIMAKKL
jgi:hypothetical protein